MIAFFSTVLLNLFPILIINITYLYFLFRGTYIHTYIHIEEPYSCTVHLLSSLKKGKYGLVQEEAQKCGRRGEEREREYLQENIKSMIDRIYILVRTIYTRDELRGGVRGGTM
jgi:hypothetical protein